METAPKDEEARDGLTQAEQTELKQLGSIPQLTETQDMRLRFLRTKRDQAKAKASERRFMIGLGIAALVCFYFSIMEGLDDYRRFNKATGIATGQVVEVWENNDEGKRPSRTPQAATSRKGEGGGYQFKVDGINYDGWGYWDQSLAKGDPVQVYYNPENPAEFNHAKGDRPQRGFISEFFNGFVNGWTFFGIICLIWIFKIVREQRKKSRVVAYDEQAAQAAYDRYRRSMERQGRVKPQN